MLWMSVASGYLIQHVGWQKAFILEGLPSMVWSIVWLCPPCAFRKPENRLYGILKFQRDLSLLGSNLTSAGVLLPIALRTTGWLGLGMTLG